MAIKQLSVFVENKTGSLLGLVKKLSEQNVNLRAMSVADTKDFGILRIIVADADKAREIIGSESLVSVNEVIAVEMSDEAGSLYNILKILGDAKINIEYMYAFTASTDLGAYVVIRVNDNAAAESVLHANGIPTLNQEGIHGI
ncbi:MAG TPA: hypothetical protein IAC39_01465 [Candidatus Faeciplasma pullistercoris]|uniref:ACT domain-containing protein n=1 Tax=Candidatus Faeciplasma pullistercoris TaxID=2840800 RepID=A0A9D1GSU9_9FIRM|nr:hypothetical protein [Candidatus Faeciplasma pullistercoris]